MHTIYGVDLHLDLKEAQDDSDNQELLDIGIDLGDGREEHIIVYEGDNAQKVADGFCQKHNLDDRQHKLLVGQIKDAMEEELRNRLAGGAAHDENPQQKPAQALYEDPISENVEEDDITEHNNISQAVNKIPVMGTRLAIRSLAVTPPKPPPAVAIGVAKSEASEKQRKPEDGWEKMVGRKLRQQVSVGKEAADVRPLFPDDLRGEAADLLEADSKLKRGASQGEIGRGLGLYERGMKTKANLQKLARDKAKERKQKEMEGVTFRPTINKAAKYLNKRVGQKRPEDRMLEQVKRAQEKQEQLKQSMEKAGVAQCTFKPEINKK